MAMPNLKRDQPMDTEALMARYNALRAEYRVLNARRAAIVAEWQWLHKNLHREKEEFFRWIQEMKHIQRCLLEILERNELNGREHVWGREHISNFSSTASHLLPEHIYASPDNRIPRRPAL